MEVSGKTEMNESRATPNGNHGANGVSHIRSPLPQTNGNTNASANAGKGSVDQPSSLKAFEQIHASVNGTSFSHGASTTSTSTSEVAQQPYTLNMDDLPPELLAIVSEVGDEHYVDMQRLFKRAAQSCWSDLVAVMRELAQRDAVHPLQDSKVLSNDNSGDNRWKKQKLWDFAENHKRALIKLLVILQWSSKSEENRATIALNFYLHKLRSWFIEANDHLGQWLDYMTSRQDACPDLESALEILASGRLAGLPDLGYVEEKKLTEKQMLRTLNCLNTILCVRMVVEENLPQSLHDYRVHDGRVTFKVPGEFELDVSVMSEESNALFGMVDMRFSFRPAPAVSQDLLQSIENIVNHQLGAQGLPGAYAYLHSLSLTQKLVELHMQALKLMHGPWAGHLQVEMLERTRTLVIYYWSRRPSSKSWIEIGIKSGRDQQNPGSDQAVPYLFLQWKRHGGVVTDHEIEMDLFHLSIEDTLNQVIAQHVNFIFDGIYERLVSSKLYAAHELTLDQESSLTDAFDCNLFIEVSKLNKFQVKCDPVAGTIALSPAGERAHRLENELAQSKNIVEDFVNRFTNLRCATAQAQMTSSIKSSTWQPLPGRKPSLHEVRYMFGPSALRAVFYRQRHWHRDWMLAAAFTSTGDEWYLVYESEAEKQIVQPLKQEPIHLQRSLSFDYFERIANFSAAVITSQVNYQAVTMPGISSIHPEPGNHKEPVLRVLLDNKENFASVKGDLIVRSHSSKRVSSGHLLVAFAKVNAPRETLQQLASTGLDSLDLIQAEEQMLTVKIESIVGESGMKAVLARLHYIDDLISCIKLLQRYSVFRMQKLTLNDILIDYYTGPGTSLGLKMSLLGAEPESRIELLPAHGNPHSLIAKHFSQIISQENKSLSDRLEALLVALRMTLPLMRCLQYLQGLVKAEDVPEMSGAVDLAESRKWLSVRVIPRDMLRFGVHYETRNTSFKHDIEAPDTSAKVLARLEIEPLTSGNGMRQSWIVRPAIAEFRTYVRPSITSQNLENRLKERVWMVNDKKGWRGLDKAASCVVSKPYQLFTVTHNTILEWLKEAVASNNESPMDPVPAAVNQNMLQDKSNQLKSQNVQMLGNNLQQGRPPNIQQNSTSRVMTAPPQQVRQQPTKPLPNGQRKPGQPNPNRNQSQNQNRTPNNREVIDLDGD